MTSDAPMTLVSNTRRHCVGVGVHEADERADPRRVDEAVDAAEPGGGLLDGGAARRLVGDVALDGERARSGVLGGVGEPLLAAGQERDLRPALGQPDPDAPTEPARGPYDDDAHPVPPALDDPARRRL